MDNSKGYVIHPKDRAGASGPWLKSRLMEQGLSLHPDSSIYRGLDNLEKLRDLIHSENSTGVQSVQNHFTFFSESYGADFLTKALHWGSDMGLQLTSDQWKQITSANPLITVDGKSHTSRNKVWETVIGCIARTFCENVEFKEPDILCSFNGQKIAVAAKMAYSDKNLIENIRKGFKQARESNNSNDADAYLIFINVVSPYPVYDTFRSILKTRIDNPSALNNKLTAEATKWCDKLPLNHEAKKLKSKTNKPVGVAFFIPLMLIVNGTPMPFFYTHFPLVWTLESLEYKFGELFLQKSGLVLGYPHMST